VLVDQSVASDGHSVSCSRPWPGFPNRLYYRETAFQTLLQKCKYFSTAFQQNRELLQSINTLLPVNFVKWFGGFYAKIYAEVLGQMSYKILYVEDNPDNRMLVRRLLMSCGYEITEASTAHEALEALKMLVPDLILMDINMPDMDGYTLTAVIKENKALEKVPVIALTANVMRGDRERTLSAGCDGYIEKPIDIDRFFDQIEAFLAMSQR